MCYCKVRSLGYVCEWKVIISSMLLWVNVHLLQCYCLGNGKSAHIWIHYEIFGYQTGDLCVCIMCFFLTERRFKKTVFAGGRGLPLCQKWVPTPTPEFWTLLCAECQSGRYGSCMCFSDVETNLINVPNLKFHPKGKQTWKHQIKQENSLHWSGCCWVLVHFKWSEDTVYKDH